LQDLNPRYFGCLADALTLDHQYLVKTNVGSTLSFVTIEVTLEKPEAVSHFSSMSENPI